MDTLTEIRKGEIVTPIPVQIMFGGCPVDPELVDVFGAQPNWNEPDIDEKLDARCCSL